MLIIHGIWYFVKFTAIYAMFLLLFKSVVIPAVDFEIAFFEKLAGLGSILASYCIASFFVPIAEFQKKVNEIRETW